MIILTRIANQTFSKHSFFLNLKQIVTAQSLHTSSNRVQSSETQETKPPVKKIYKYEYGGAPVDWLPFKWTRRPKFNIIEDGGDKIKANTIDPSLPKPDFELSEELKTASESVKHMFSVATASKSEVKEVCRRELLKRIQRHPMDFDSLEVKIAEMTIKVRDLYEYRKKYDRKKFVLGRVVLPILIQKRNKMLKHLRAIDNDRFCWLLEELQLNFRPQPLALKIERYCKKGDLRRLTKEYHQKTIADKKMAYHEALKKEQEAFLEEKKNILAWIEEEERAIKALKV